MIRNNGSPRAARHGAASRRADGDNHPESGRRARAAQIKHVIFINKENATHDVLLGDITATRGGVPVDGDPAFSLGPAARPNHHELALRLPFGDNFFLEPTVSSDGHRWLTNTYTAELEETHWPASYGGAEDDSGDDPEIIANYPGRIGFTDANASPEPNDYNEHGGIYAAPRSATAATSSTSATASSSRWSTRTARRSRPASASTPTSRWRRSSATARDHLYPEFNTHIPDAPLPEQPDRFNRFGRFKQVFESHYVDRAPAAASCRATSISITPTITAAAPTTSIPPARPGTSPDSCRTTTPRWG